MAQGNEELIDKYVDRTGIASDTKFFLEHLNTIMDAFNKINNFKLKFSLADGQFETSKISKEAADQFDRIAAANKKMDDSFAKNSNGAKAQAASLRELIEASVKNEIAMKNLAKSKKELDLAFKAGSITAEEYALELTDIKEKEVLFKIESKQVEQALKNIQAQAKATGASLDELNNELKETGQSIPSAGGEASGGADDSTGGGGSIGGSAPDLPNLDTGEADALAESYKKLFIQLQAINSQKTELKLKLSEINEAYAKGRISAEEYIDRTAKVNFELSKLDVEGKQAATGLRNVAKDAKASEGSLNSLRSQLSLAQQAFDAMGKAERESADGKELLEKINTLDAAVKELEFSSGRFQRNVGNYQGAAKTIVSALNEIEKEITELTTKQTMLQNVSNRTVVTGFGKSGPGGTTAQLKEVNAQIGFTLKQSQALNKVVSDPRFINLGKKTTDATKDLKFLKQVLQELEKVGLRDTQVFKELQGQIGGLSNNLQSHGRSIDGFSNRLKNLGTSFISLIGLASIGSIFSSAIDEFTEMDKNVRILQNTLKNLGIPEAFGRIETSAKKLKGQFEFLDDDEILKVFNQLIVYGKLTEDQINELLPVIIDFSAATGKDLSSATDEVIKALEGNGRELKRFGINMKDAKSVTEGFGLVMKELKPRVEGVGAAFSDSAAGGLAIAKQEFKDLKEELGQGLLPVLNSILSALLKIVTGAAGAAKALKDVFTGDASFVGSIVTQTLGTDEKAQKAIEDDVKANLGFLKGQQDDLKELQKAGKKLDITTEDVTKDFLNNLIKKNKDTAVLVNELKKTGDVQGLKSALVAFESERQTIEQLQGKLSGGGVLGIGDPDDKRGADKKDKTKNFELELFKFRQNLIIEENKKISEIELLSSKTRIEALQKIAEAERAIILAESTFELKETGLTAAKIVEIRKQLSEALTQEDRERIEAQFGLTKEQILLFEKSVDAQFKANDKLLTGITTITQQAKQKIKDEQAALLADLDATSEKLRSEEQKKYQTRLDDQKKFLEERLLFIQTDTDNELAKLNERYDNDLISKEKFEEEKLRIERKAIKASLQAKLDYYEFLLKIERDVLGGDKEKINILLGEIAKLNKELAELGANTPDPTETWLENFEEFLEKAQNIFSKAQEIISGFFGAIADRQKNEIQEQINLIDERTAKEIESINQTTTNKEEANAKIQIIEARAAAQKRVLENRQRQADIQRAQFEKASNIARIVIEGALSVVKAANSAPPPFNIPAIIGAAALAAGQLAVAIATPIPKFKEGKNFSETTTTNNDTYEGYAVVGDGGRSELIQREDGSMEVTPSKPTVTWVSKDDVIYPDAQQAIKKKDEEDKQNSEEKPAGSMNTVNEGDTIHNDVVKPGNDISIKVDPAISSQELATNNRAAKPANVNAEAKAIKESLLTGIDNYFNNVNTTDNTTTGDDRSATLSRLAMLRNEIASADVDNTESSNLFINKADSYYKEINSTIPGIIRKQPVIDAASELKKTNHESKETEKAARSSRIEFGTKLNPVITEARTIKTELLSDIETYYNHYRSLHTASDDHSESMNYFANLAKEISNVKLNSSSSDGYAESFINKVASYYKDIDSQIIGSKVRSAAVPDIIPKMDFNVNRTLILPDVNRAISQTRNITDRYARDSELKSMMQTVNAEVDMEPLTDAMNKNFKRLEKTIKNKTENHFHVENPLRAYLRKTGDSWTNKL